MHMDTARKCDNTPKLQDNSQQQQHVSTIWQFVKSFFSFIQVNEASLTPDGQVIYVHLVPVVVLYGIDKGIPLGFIQVDFTVCCLQDFIYMDQNDRTTTTL